MKLSDKQRSYILLGLDEIRSHAVDNDDLGKADEIQHVEKIVRADSDRCPNCPNTERTLAQAVGIIEKMLAAGRCLANAERAAQEHTESLKQQRIAAHRWLEGIAS